MRVTTLGCRFLFIFALARLMQPAEVGLYGLMAATITYGLFVVGLDFYIYTTRELIYHKKTDWGQLLKNQIALSIATYAITLPALIILFERDYLPWELAKWFFILLVLEHICQETTRIFIAASEQLSASFIIFLRQGAWTIAAISLMVTDLPSRNLDTVFFAWTIGCISAIIFAALKIKVLNISGWAAAIDKKWIWKGIKTSIPFLIATLALRGISTIDRYWVQNIGGLELVGAYVLFFGIANTLIAFLDAGVFSFSYPKMISSYKNNEYKNYKKTMKEMIFLTLALTILFIIASSSTLPFLVDWLDKAIYKENIDLFYGLLIATTVSALGMPLHYALYSQNKDKPIIQAHLSALPVFITTVSFSSLWLEKWAVPVALCVTQTFILGLKLRAYLRNTPKLFFGIKPE